MVLRTAFLLVVNLASVQLWHFNLLGRCHIRYKIMIGQVITISNPHWPGLYNAGENCRWTFDCPYGYNCQLRCYYISMPHSSNCTSDKLMVSRSGDKDFYDAESYCGRTYIKARSKSTRIVLGLVTNAQSTGGRFRCAIRTEPIMHVDSFGQSNGHKLRFLNIMKNRTGSQISHEGTKHQSDTIAPKRPLSVLPTPSLIDAFMDAMGLPIAKQQFGRRALAKKTTITPLDSLLHSLELDLKKNMHNKERKRILASTALTSKRTRQILFTTAKPRPFRHATLSVFNALIESII